MRARFDFALDLAERALKGGIPRAYHLVGSGLSALLSTSRVPFEPSVLFVEVTTKCNLRCFMCPHTFQEYENKDMSYEQFEGILDQLPNVNMLIPQGIGEPLLCKDIFSMIRCAKRHGMIINFNTNGMLLTDDRARATIDSGLDMMSVSIDGATQETYRKIRGGGDLARVVDSLRRLVELKAALGSSLPDLSIRTVVSRENILEIPKIIELGASIGIRQISIQDLVTYGSALEDSSIGAADYVALVDCRRDAAKRGIKIVLENFSRFQRPSRRCVSPWVSPNITREGYVTPCCVISDPSLISFGNVFSTPFSNIWNGDEFVAFRRDFRAGRAPAFCRGCPRY